jgi:hypothetical protein
MTTRLSRRQALRLALLTGFGGLAAACSPGAAAPAAEADFAPPGTSAPAAARPSAAAPATTAPATTAAPQSATAPAAATAAPPAPTQAPAAQATAAPQTDGLAAGITSATTALLAALADDARAKATYAFGDAERVRWHWTTPAGFPRNGLPLTEMTEDQRALALALLRASVSEAGFKKASDIMALQNVLGNDPLLYFVTVFGTPGGAAPWGWRFEGHHLSRHFTIAGDRVVAMPFFNGAWPTETDAGLRAMPREDDAARELVTSLDDATRAAAIFQARTLTNHVTQNEPYVQPLDPVGVTLGQLGGQQRALAVEIIQTYLASLPDSIAKPTFDRITAVGIEGIRFGWAGELEPRRPHYYRLQGPTFLLEFDNSRNRGTHIHSVWRDFDGDFGQQIVR